MNLLGLRKDKIMKVLVAIDSFKGSATSKELNEALIESITDSRVTEKISVPIADGGEGTVHALYDSLGGKFYIEEVPDLTGKMMKAEYLVTTIEGKETAFIESATVVGIDRIIPSEETIKTTSTFGLGVLIKKIIEKNINEIYVTLGGSGTSDGGLGLLAGLGAEIDYKIGQNPLLTTKKIQIDSVLELLKSINLIALADVDNPYIGEKGFSAVFGPQKGGTPELLLEMDQLAEIVGQELSKLSNFSINEYPGAGAAGGLGGAVLAIGGQIKPGFQTISQLIHLEELIKTVDLVVTGEGKLDSQTDRKSVV